MLKAGRLFRFWGWLKLLRDNALLLYYAWRHPQTPGYLKGLLAALLLYLFSPIDLVPDYLPVVGIADDAVLLTSAMLFLTNLLPAQVVAESRRQSEKWRRRMPYITGIIAIAVVAWLVVIFMVIRKIMQ
ncbi:YkvA family protein [Sporomusa acidovorans]|uniref:DUF1232 domain-containing protein n=1 Tax=Sporomusa acidovorans (strain ATCC 49682 / DSM 3132 / Mol) TaxID=1123286 RepID=A0ABZ3J8A4_SPOA4|nr:DUF1232 domain-containing protein [Sporomusa acidovorans]OZC21290.1 hypothetical protein SPACI_21420 [Sporomusa acidovorans DSM 3132]SDE67173.1 Protein of unknown function [Sporomusa acidovorans]